MKSLIALIFAAMTAATAYAECTLYSTHSNAVSKQLKDAGGWAFDRYDTVCAKLKKANAAVMILSGSAVLDNRSIGWASVVVKDKESAIATSDYSSRSTQTNSYASQDKADALMWEAVNAALNDWGGVLDSALVVLEEARRATSKARVR